MRFEKRFMVFSMDIYPMTMVHYGPNSTGNDAQEILFLFHLYTLCLGIDGCLSPNIQHQILAEKEEHMKTLIHSPTLTHPLIILNYANTRQLVVFGENKTGIRRVAS